MQEVYRANKCSTNTVNCQDSRCEQHYTKMMQAVGKPPKCHTNTDSNSKSKNKDKPKVIDNENSKINNFLPGPKQNDDKRVSAEITQQLQRDFKDVFTIMRYFDGTFS